MIDDEISVIVPAYNAERYLEEALQSIYSQTLVPNQIIVVDDGSRDSTADIAASHRDIVLLQIQHSGAAAARNKGVLHASGRYMAFLDADDLWLPGKTRRQLQQLSGGTKSTAAFTLMRQFASPELTDATKKRFRVNENPVAGQMAGCLFIERELFLEVGLFDETLSAGEFIEWMLRARRYGLRFSIINEVLMLRRIHGGNSVLTNQPVVGADYLRIVRENLHRRQNG